MSEEMDDEIAQRLGEITGQFSQTEQVSYVVWGAAVSTTRAFESVTMKVDPATHRIFVSIKLRWFASSPRLKLFQDAWLRIAEKKCKEHAPNGWKVLCYYGGQKDDL